MARSKIDPAVRLRARLRSEPETGCLVWTGANAGSGYGSISVNGLNMRAHRLAYELAKGPIPDGLVIDHLCRNKRCCNPDHLEAVTSAQNTKRGIHTGWWWRQQTHCKRGHPFSDRKDAKGWRICSACKVINMNKWLEKKRSLTTNQGSEP